MYYSETDSLMLADGQKELAQRRAIRKLRKVAEELIPNSVDRFQSRVSMAFGYNCPDRIEAGIICQMLANQIQEDLDNNR